MEIADRLEQDLGAHGAFVTKLRLDAAFQAGRLADAKRYASELWREARRERNVRWVVRGWWSSAWLQIRRGDRPPAPPTELRWIAEGDLASLRQLSMQSLVLEMAEPIERALRENDLLRTQAHLRYVREEVQFARGCLALLQNRPAEARALLEPLARNSKIRARHGALARTYESLQSWKEAAAEYERLLSNSHVKWWNAPLSILDQFRLARVYEKLGDPARALQWYERFTEDWKDADPDIPELIEARERLGEMREVEVTVR
jgi:tetratricopeptide (TPR) repeat protein